MNFENMAYYYNGKIIFDENMYENDEIDDNVGYGTWIPEW